MAWTTVTASGNGRRNDDLARVLEHGGVLDLLLLDGATSLAERDYVDPVDGDPAWFVRCFADAFAAVVADAPLDGDVEHACVQRALAGVRAQWAARGGSEAPLYAWPIAALAWVRVRPDGAGVHIETWCLGDCKLLLGMRGPAGSAVRDLDPYDNVYEHALQRAVAELVADGVDDPAARFAALTPTLRARREEQMLAEAPDVLCLEPRGPFAARRNSVRIDAHEAEAGAGLLLAMSDGYYRLVDPYALYDDAGLMRAAAANGPDALLAELRRFEAGRDTAALSVKGADDATAIALDIGAMRAVRDAAPVRTLQDGAQIAQVQRYVAAYNAFDVDAMLAELHPDVRFEHHSGGALALATDGIEAFRTLAVQAVAMFSEREQRVTGIEQLDGVLLADIAWRGMPAVDIPGGPSAGAVLELSGQSEFAFAEGRIVRIVDRSAE